MKKVLVFPCGSEVAMEIYRSLKYSSHLEIFGGSSVEDHGKFLFKNYIGGIPTIDSEDIIPVLRNIIASYNIDAIYPAMDKVITILKKYEKELGCKVISSDLETTEICLSKKRTYLALKDYVKVPEIYASLEEVSVYPVFFKPEIGYGSRGVYLAKTQMDAQNFLEKSQNNHNTILMMKYLPGEEFTVDCFTDKNGTLLFCAARKRNRIMNGISVNTFPEVNRHEEFEKIARSINANLNLRGAWFFQVKEDTSGELTLLEVASRLGGSSALYRNTGVNFALLTVFDAFNYDVKITQNDYYIELDRALSNRYYIDLEYEEVFVDFDDCLIIHGKVNVELIAFLFQALNSKKRLTLITRHSYLIATSLEKFRLQSLFDEIIHITKEDEKYRYIKNPKAIFIDDSFIERKKVKDARNIPVFAPDMIESLLHI